MFSLPNQKLIENFANFGQLFDEKKEKLFISEVAGIHDTLNSRNLVVFHETGQSSFPVIHKF